MQSLYRQPFVSNSVEDLSETGSDFYGMGPNRDTLMGRTTSSLRGKAHSQ